jgi:hypothetical protein
MKNDHLPLSPTNGLKVFHSDDPDPEKAGQGLGTAPFLNHLFPVEYLRYWQMSPAEQIGLIYLLQQLQPKVAIEIGTRFGGSLQVLAKYCEQVYSLDIDPEVPVRLAGQYQNVEYLIGPSTQTLPALLKKMSAGKAELAFVLVDGDHSAEGVRADINALLQFQPVVPLYIVMHDSFNPECRSGLRAAAWAECSHVHLVELDFVGGIINPSPAFRGQLWGGLALGLLLPEPARSRVQITSRAELTFQAAVAATQKKPLLRRLKNRLKACLKPS